MEEPISGPTPRVEDRHGNDLDLSHGRGTGGRSEDVAGGADAWPAQSDGPGGVLGPSGDESLQRVDLTVRRTVGE